ncbi:MAG: Rossmann-like domain-containing protein [Candidatus Hodarchaeales archaeon]|jgi:uncharacterized protein (DUF4213/DUF364 family)
MQNFWNFTVEYFQKKGYFVDVHVNDLYLGLSYSGMIVNDDIMGLTYTALPDTRFHTPFSWSGELQKKSLNQLIRMFNSSNLLERTIGLVTINAISQVQLKGKLDKYPDLPLISILGDVHEKEIGMIGLIKPIADDMIKSGAYVKVMDSEHKKNQMEGVQTIQVIEELKNVSHLFVSGTAMLFNDFIDLVNLKIKGKKILIGPSAQIIPEIPFQFNFDVVASSFIEYPIKAMQIIKQAGGYYKTKNLSKKYMIIK